MAFSTEALAHVGGMGVGIEFETRRERNHASSPVARSRRASRCASMSPDKWTNTPLGNFSVQEAVRWAAGSSSSRMKLGAEAAELGAWPSAVLSGLGEERGVSELFFYWQNSL